METKNFYGTVGYKMPIKVAQEYLKSSKFKKNDFYSDKAQEELCKIVNESYGILGNCVKVIVY